NAFGVATRAGLPPSWPAPPDSPCHCPARRAYRWVGHGSTKRRKSMAKATRFADLDVSHLGPDATEQDLVEFLDYAEDLKAKHPDLTQEEIMDRLFGHDGDW